MQNPPTVLFKLVPAPGESGAQVSVEAVEELLGSLADSGTTRFLHDVINSALRGRGLATSALNAAAFYNLLKLWSNDRSGRMLNIRAYDIEVVTTGMDENDVGQLFHLLQESGDEAAIQNFFSNAGQPRPEAH